MKATKFSNPQIVTVAVYLLGGDRQYVDTEDIAVKASELAPGRFEWRKHKDQINLELVRVYLSDAKKAEHGVHLQGSGSDGWMLTERGLAFAREAAGGIDPNALKRTPMNAVERRRYGKERQRLLSTDAFTKFAAGRAQEIDPRDAEIFFRVNDYVMGAARKRKIDRIVTMFSEDQVLGDAVRTISQMLTKTEGSKDHAR